MGNYLNPNNGNYARLVNSRVYVDKTEMLSHLNEVIGTEQAWICVSRPRRFGKTLAAEMISAYYSRGCSSDALFGDKKIAASDSYGKWLNQCNVIKWDMSAAIQNYGGAGKAVTGVVKDTVGELDSEYPEALSQIDHSRSFPLILSDLYLRTSASFVFIIDEWDAIYREGDDVAQAAYTRLLRGLFKASESKYFTRLAYLTGILPIKRYNSESALNNFREYTMTSPKVLAQYVGFTDEEVRTLCEEWQMDFDEMRRMYDGYSFRRARHVYCPNSVVNAILDEEYRCYWTQTSSYEAVRTYISMDYEGLKGDIITMLGGGRCHVNTYGFENDMKYVRNRDDVLTVLIHLGYLAYDSAGDMAYVPNEEVRIALERAVSDVSWEPVVNAIRASENLMQALLRKDTEAVAAGVERAHMEHASILKFNDENSLACVIRLAFYNAVNEFEIISEMPAGFGYADLVFLPVRSSNKPALVVELKYNDSPEAAIEQIRRRRYPQSLEHYTGRILLVGISYNKEDPDKKHSCVIEEWEKSA